MTKSMVLMIERETAIDGDDEAAVVVVVVDFVDYARLNVKNDESFVDDEMLMAAVKTKMMTTTTTTKKKMMMMKRMKRTIENLT